MDKQICCKDCRFYTQDKGYCNIARVSSNGIVLIGVTDGYYCAYAEAKDAKK